MATPRRIAALLLLSFLATTSVARADGLVEPGALAGRVSGGATPLAAAAVYAYQLGDLKLWRGVTDEKGRFLFEKLPAGLYKIIAAKTGFLPAIVKLTRSSAGKRQWIDVQLVEERPGVATAAGFWSVREQIPPDVLREIDLLGETVLAAGSTVQAVQVEARLQALTGVDERLPDGGGQLTGGRVDLRGEIRDVRLDLEGDFSQLQPVDFGGALNGSTQQLTFNVEGRGAARVQVSSTNNRLDMGGNEPDVIGLESHRVSWSQPFGEGRSTIEAQYTAESNFYGFGVWAPLGVPTASRSWRLEGSYATPLTDRVSLETGFRYREREGRYANEQGMVLPSEQIDLFGRGGLQISPGVLLEYGLYSTLRDGSLWLTPRGGVVMQLGPAWQAGSSVSSRFRADGEDRYELVDFAPAYFGDAGDCEQGEELCYRVFVARDGKEGRLSVGATHRQFAETLRLYFDRDFYNFFESIYLVDGDALPELTFEMERRLAPGILARLESNLAAGGGGVLLNTSQVPYENDVRYLITSIDTQFERTSTGLFLSFHHLAQNLNPVASMPRKDTHQALKRLQVMVTQDLAFLKTLASDLALQLNMEFSRGSLPSGRQYDDPEQLRRRVTGGVAVKF
ncbi:MAG: hypothetical protein ACE5EG_01780 [Thermoanaerobaculia bacterium]